ncbi:MAG: hypothetical protein IJ174_01055 [Clostridia bacterium]|nr:hypothetical protein [Clostridia bacterium]
MEIGQAKGVKVSRKAERKQSGRRCGNGGGEITSRAGRLTTGGKQALKKTSPLKVVQIPKIWLTICQTCAIFLLKIHETFHENISGEKKEEWI